MSDTYDLQIYKGSTYSLNITIKDSYSVPIDLVGYTVSGLLKFKYSSSGYLTNLNATRVAPYTSGVINLSIPSIITSALPTTLGFYDVEIYGTGDSSVTKVLNGKAIIFPESTW